MIRLGQWKIAERLKNNVAPRMRPTIGRLALAAQWLLLETLATILATTEQVGRLCKYVFRASEVYLLRWRAWAAQLAVGWKLKQAGCGEAQLAGTIDELTRQIEEKQASIWTRLRLRRRRLSTILILAASADLDGSSTGAATAEIDIWTLLEKQKAEQTELLASQWQTLWPVSYIEVIRVGIGLVSSLVLFVVVPALLHNRSTPEPADELALATSESNEPVNPKPALSEQATATGVRTDDEVKRVPAVAEKDADTIERSGAQVPHQSVEKAGSTAKQGTSSVLLKPAGTINHGSVSDRNKPVRPVKQMNSVRDYKVGRIGLGTKLEAVRKVHPEQKGMAAFVAGDSSSAPTYWIRTPRANVMFEFKDSEVVVIGSLYQMASYDKVLMETSNEFGEPHYLDPATRIAMWEFVDGTVVLKGADRGREVTKIVGFTSDTRLPPDSLYEKLRSR